MLSIFSHLIQMENDMTEISERIANSLLFRKRRNAQIRSAACCPNTTAFRNPSACRTATDTRARSAAFSTAWPFLRPFFEKKTNSLSGGERTRLALAALLLKSRTSSF